MAIASSSIAISDVVIIMQTRLKLQSSQAPRKRKNAWASDFMVSQSPKSFNYQFKQTSKKVQKKEVRLLDLDFGLGHCITLCKYLFWFYDCTVLSCVAQNDEIIKSCIGQHGEIKSLVLQNIIKSLSNMVKYKIWLFSRENP